jgi:hypothetical protein
VRPAHAITPSVRTSSAHESAARGIAYSHGAAPRSAGVSDSIAQRMNGSATPRRARRVVARHERHRHDHRDGADDAAHDALARSSRNSSSCARSRAACSSNATVGRGSSAP